VDVFSEITLWLGFVCVQGCDLVIISCPVFIMTSQPKGRFAAYRQTLAAIAARTGTPLPSLILSFGILHELTAVVPLVGIFYSSRALGIGERVVSAIIEDKRQNSTNYEASTNERSQLSWGKQKLKLWVEEGDRWAIRIGRRYGIFGYEKRKPGTVDNVEEMTGVTGHIAGDVANAILAYGATKVRPSWAKSGFDQSVMFCLIQALLPLRIGVSVYFSPSFSRTIVEPIRKTIIQPFRSNP